MGDISIAEEDPRAGDVAALIGELDQYLSDLYPAESNHLMGLESLAADNVVFLVARQDGKAVGCVALVREAPDWAELKRIYVPPAARGAGVGQAMLAAVESAGRDMGLQWIRIETGTRQPEALSLFERAGYARRDRFGAYPLGDPWSIFMEKALF